MLLVVFGCVALVAGWRYWRRRRAVGAIVAGAALGLMHATKETFLLSLLVAGLALAVNQMWNRLLDASRPSLRAQAINPAHLIAALAVWLVIAAILFTS